jgi:hypothetical protein
MNAATQEQVRGAAHRWLAQQIGYDPAQLRICDPNTAALRPDLGRYSGEQAFTEFTLSLFLRYHLAAFPKTSITLLNLEPTLTQKLLEVGVFEVSDVENLADTLVTLLTHQEFQAVITAHFQFNLQQEW